jgi:hypothetical protein
MKRRTTIQIDKNTIEVLDEAAHKYNNSRQASADLILKTGLKIIKDIGLDEFLKLGKKEA